MWCQAYRTHSGALHRNAVFGPVNGCRVGFRKQRRWLRVESASNGGGQLLSEAEKFVQSLSGETVEFVREHPSVADILEERSKIMSKVRFYAAFRSL